MNNIMIENSWDKLPAFHKSFLIIDENVARFCLDNFPNMPKFILPAGENCKNMDNVVKILEAMYKAGLDRQSVVFACGGGVVTDLGGFVASIYMRGIAHVNLPTTLMGMVDAALGGKTGVDFLGGKNLIGTFHQPYLVYCNITTLTTLTQEDFISGLAEVIKYGIIRDVALLDYLQDNHIPIIERNLDVLTHIIKQSVHIKMDIVAKDEREGGLRQILNFGHTFGHAIEAALGFTLSHGFCVALGMVCALDYSIRNLGLAPDDAEFVINLMKSYGLPHGGGHIPHQLTADQIYKLMLRDKKTKHGQLTIIATPKLGMAEIINNPPKTQILKSIKRIL